MHKSNKIDKNQRITQINIFHDNKFKWNEQKLLARIWFKFIRKFGLICIIYAKKKKIINKQYSIQINIFLGANFLSWKKKNGSSKNKLVIMQMNA